MSSTWSRVAPMPSAYLATAAKGESVKTPPKSNRTALIIRSSCCLGAVDGHPGVRVLQRREAGLLVDAVRVGGGEQHPAAGLHVRVRGGSAGQQGAQTAAAVGGVDVHVAEVGEGRAVGD